MDDLDENESVDRIRHSNSVDSIMSSPNIPSDSLSASLKFQMDTPFLGEEAKASLRRQHTMHISDSGFSEWSPCTASQESLDQTPNLQGASSLQNSISSSPAVEPVPPKLSPRNHRRSWPLKSRKLSFLSLDGPAASPVLDITSQHRLQCDSDPSLSEEVGKVMLPKLESSGSSKHSLLSQVLHRSRSSSRSPSSVSDDLENSFQEMSLEESSSDSSAQHSPHSPFSSSPVFSFMPHRAVNIKSHPFDTENNLSPLATSAINRESAESSGACISQMSSPVTTHTSQHLVSSQIANTHKENLPHTELDMSQADFVARLSLAPVQSHLSLLQSIVSQDCLEQPAIPRLHESCLSMADRRKPSKLDFQLCCANGQRSHECNISSLEKPVVSPLIKSPSKRNASKSGKGCAESVSPSKMRRLRTSLCAVAESNSKRDLFGSDQSVRNSCLETPKSDDRVPQFLCLSADAQLLGKLRSTPPTGISPGEESVRLKQLPSGQGNESQWEQIEQQKTAELIDRVCGMFSPAHISKLIGRRIGVKQLDIVKELWQQNLMECLGLIFSYVPDSDLMKLLEVSTDWKEAVLAETKASRRYKALWRKLNSPRKKNKQSANKENVVDKLPQVESALLTPSKGHLTAVQPQTTARLETVSKNLNFQHSHHDLHFDDRVRHCPHCHSRAVILPSQDRAICMADKCAYDFCTKCFCQFHHSSPCKPLFHLASRTTLAGTKKSKKNLKRLKNL